MNKSKSKKSKRKNPIWFYLIVITIPILFFLLLEISLDLFNYGRNDDQWVSVSETMQMLNPDIGGRYFFNTKNFPQSNNEAFDITKKKDAFRIFVFGGSSAAGFPYSPNGTFSRYINDALQILYPRNCIEVINIAITATNTYTIRDLLPDVLKQNPDLILIYSGHNEYYGALGVGSVENIGNQREYVHFLIWLNSFKTIEFLRNIVNSVSTIFSKTMEQDYQQSGTLMARIVDDQIIKLNSEKFQAGINQFNGNLEVILHEANNEGIPVAIANLVSNLKDQKPFVSVDDEQFELADSVFQKANQQLERNNTKKADSLFRLAKDLDALRFRAPEKINSIISTLSQKYNCALVDLDSIFKANSKNGVAGNNLFVDHLHPTLTGHFLMGKSFLAVIKKRGFLPKENATRIDAATLDSMVVFNFSYSKLDSVVAKIRLQGLLNDWPFVDKQDFSFINKLILIDKIDTLAYKVAIENTNWETAHRNAAEWYLLNNDYENFSIEMKVLTTQYSFKLSYFDFASSELINAKMYDLAYPFLIKRFNEIPNAYSSKWLGNINLNRDEIDSAISYLKQSIIFNDKDSQVYYNLCGAYIKKEEYEKALKNISKCVELNPNFSNAKKIQTQLLGIVEKNK